jgi:hypothetical protein
MDNQSDTGQQRLRTLAESLDCFTEEEHLLMTGWSPATAESKRKRRQGPPYIRHGKHYFYPRQQYIDYVKTLVREPCRVAAREAL